MIGNKWFCQPDDKREAWCFLTLERDGESEGCAIRGWKVGYGNAKKMVRKSEKTACREKTALKSLLREVYHCKKQNIPIITRKEEAQILRTRLFFLGKEDVNLQNVEFLYMKELLKRHFVSSEIPSSIEGLAKRISIERKNSDKVELLRKIFLRILPLLPEESLGVIG